MQKNKGSALVYSLIILATMLFIVSSISVVSLTEKKNASSTDFSTQAFQTADSGFQLGLKAINSHLSDPLNTVFSCNVSDGTVTVTDVGLTGATYTLSFQKTGGVPAACGDLASSVTSIKSIGTYKNTIRAVEVAVAASGALTVQSDQNVLTDQCGGTLDSGLCSSAFYVDIVFPTSFTSAPKVIVSPANISSSNPACVGGATDKVISYADSITKTGFRMYCSGSPSGASCPSSLEGYATKAKCSWMAVGS